MLYTFSQAQYDSDELTQIFQQITANDAVVLWQNGVLQAVKYPTFFANRENVFALENDVKARGLSVNIPQISLQQFVQISEQYYPQCAF